MAVYVAEILGRGIAAFAAANDAEAHMRLADRAFKRDLIVLQNEGRALWDGISQIKMRSASPAEAAAWQAGVIVGEQGRAVFLVAVVDPSHDRFDDDDDHDDDHGD